MQAAAEAFVDAFEQPLAQKASAFAAFFQAEREKRLKQQPGCGVRVDPAQDLRHEQLIDLRHGGQDSGVIRRERPKHRLSADRLDIMHRRAGKRRAEHQTDKAVNMGIRQNAEIAVIGLEPLYFERHARGFDERVMRMQNARCLARSPGRKEDARNFFIRIGRLRHGIRHTCRGTRGNGAVEYMKHREQKRMHRQFLPRFFREKSGAHIGKLKEIRKLFAAERRIKQHRCASQPAYCKKCDRPLGA